MSSWDVAVVGGGAAGLLAATRAAERGRRTILLEKNKRPGVKILISGGTRCNITQNTDARGIVAAFGPNGKFLHSAVAAFGPREIVALVEAEGCATKVEETGKIFPVSDKSSDVLGALMKRFGRSGATMELLQPVESIERADEGFRVTSKSMVVTAPKVILTTGGLSYAAVGTTGDGLRFAQRLGHTLVSTRPALTPVTSAAPWIPGLAGLTLPDVDVRVVDPATPGKAGVLASRRGSLLFTHQGLSGPVILDVSRAVSGHPRPSTLELRVNLLPDTKEAEIGERLQREATLSGRRQIAGVLGEMIPRRLAEVILGLASVPVERKLSELAKGERAKLAASVAGLAIPVKGTLGYEKAEVTAGGVSLAEVDSRTMESKLVPGLYFAGEILDLDGWIGGYNFQSAFSTGWAAGSNA